MNYDAFSKDNGGRNLTDATCQREMPFPPEADKLGVRAVAKAAMARRRLRALGGEERCSAERIEEVARDCRLHGNNGNG
jgi:hypothetical protein